MESELVLAVAVGLGLGMGLMTIIQMMIRWDGQRRLSAELAERNRLYREAAAAANQRPAADRLPRRRPPADMTGPIPPVPPVPAWDGNGQKRAPWDDPLPAGQLAAPPYTRPYTDRRPAPAAGTF